MAKRYRRRRYVRHIPAVLGVVVLVSSVGVLKLNAVASANDAKHAQLAAAQRSADQTASRGLPRTGDSSLATDSTTSSTDSTSTTVAPTTIPPTTVPPTTAPPTTAKPTTTTVKPAPPTTAKPVAPAATTGNTQTGGGSYYSYRAGGCAHKTLPKGTVVTVTNLANGKTTTCVVDDRGPYVGGRIIDLDTTVFRQIASTSSGVIQVRISW